jgi:peptidoglycan/xylan/chitin deacetylase (PgdA/CDA1 family)
MKWLSDRGYSTVTISEVTRAIMNGQTLPDRPVVITFDDGYLDVYQNAYPILEKYGFYATFFIIGNTVDTRGNLSTDQLLELVNDGWEIGCHSMNHSYLTSGNNLEQEIVGSKELLEEKIGEAVLTFAYPYGLTNWTVTNYTINAGYTSAVGLGSNMTHSTSSLFFLHRKEIKSWYTLDFFEQFLPWK